MKKIVTLFFVLFIFGTAAILSQTLKGKIYDRKTGKPIPGVSIYLNGTSLSTSTDTEGKYSLNINQVMNTDLMISHVSYNMVSVPNPFEENPEIIYLTLKDNTLKEVFVYADTHSTREEKLLAFKKEFFGDTPEGKSCIIKNEDDLQLYYNEEKKMLIASSEVPLIIENQMLGYEIQVLLKNYFALYPLYDHSTPPPTAAMYSAYMYAKSVMKFDKADRVFWESINLFKDLKPDDKKVKMRRQNIYDQSYIAFFKNLANNSLKEANFKIYDRRKEMKSEKYFHVTKMGPYLKKVSLKDGQVFPIGEDLEGRKSYGLIKVQWKNRSSMLNFLTDSFVVDEFGNAKPINDLVFSGEMSTHRFGYALPLDYKRGD